MKLEIKLLTEAEIDSLAPFLTALAAYHNRVAVNFSGCYPLVSVSDKCVLKTVLLQANRKPLW